MTLLYERKDTLDFTRLDQFLVGLEQYGMAGTDLCVYLDNKLVHRHTNGLANREKNIPITMEPLFTMTPGLSYDLETAP